MACCVPSTGTAQDLTTLSLDQLLNMNVITASKFEQKASDAPSSVSIITSQDIKTFGYRTLTDVLRSIRGIHVAYDRNYSYLGTRGVGRNGDYNTRVLVLVDGQRLNDAVYSQGAIGTEFPIDLEVIERIEYVPGPGSAIYGSNAFFGVLNIITRRDATGTTLAVSAASHGTGEARFMTGHRFANGADALVSISGYNSRGADAYFPEFDSADSNHGIARRLDFDRYQRVFARYGMDGLTLETFFGNRVKGIPTAAFGQQFNDPRSHTIDRFFSGTVAYSRALSKTLEMHASVNLTDYTYTGDYAYSPGADGLNRDFSHSKAYTSELRLLSRAFARHKLIVGVEASNQPIRRQENYYVTPYAGVLDTNMPQHSLAIYAQDEYRITDSLILNAGVRHDHDSEGGNSTNPRVGLIYKLTTDLTTKLLYGTAFRAPNAYERYYVADIGRYKTVSGLKSETIKTY